MACARPRYRCPYCRGPDGPAAVDPWCTVLRPARRADAVLILLCDQPRSPQMISVHWWPPGNRTGTDYGSGIRDRLGPPVIMPRSIWPQLAALRGDQGARSAGMALGHTAVPRAAFDVDTPEDLARLEAAPARTMAVIRIEYFAVL